MVVQKFIPEGWLQNEEPISEKVLKESLVKGKVIHAKVEKCDEEYNLYVNLGQDKMGIIPRSEVEAINVDTQGIPKPSICLNKLNKWIQCRVIQMDEENNYILSRKQVSKEAMQWVKENLKPGNILYGIVKNIEAYGAFVEIGGGIVGLLHIEDISVARIKSPAERLKIGQKIKVMIKCIDSMTNRIMLTYKELLGTWEENIKEFREGMIVSGIAREVEKQQNGIFIELKPNLVGLAEYKENIRYGDPVNVYIKKIIPEKKKIKLLVIQ